jgi:hypothetical protein
VRPSPGHRLGLSVSLTVIPLQEASKIQSDLPANRYFLTVALHIFSAGHRGFEPHEISLSSRRSCGPFRLADILLECPPHIRYQKTFLNMYPILKRTVPVSLIHRTNPITCDRRPLNLFFWKNTTVQYFCYLSEVSQAIWSMI